jgi:transposase-like protein
MSVLSQPQFHNEAAAFDYVEAALWPQGPICPHCGGFERISVIKANPAKKIRAGLKYCGQCRKQFTVRIGTIFEESHLPMTKWLQAIFLMCSSKKGISSHQLMRTLETTYKTAWFLSHRIREAMRSGELGPFGMGGATVEVDETFIGVEPGVERVVNMHDKMKVLSLIERDTGRARSMVFDHVSVQDVVPLVEANLHREANLRTDESVLYTVMGRGFASHETVSHNRSEYVRKNDPSIHTNTVEGYFSIFKRGMRGVYQHCGKKHLHRYLAEFDFRYSNRIALGVDDKQRSDAALRGFTGKRLTYRSTNIRPEAQA